VDFLLGLADGLWGLARDEDVVGITAARIWGRVAVDLGEERRKIDGSIRGRFQELDVLPMTAADDLVE
jgi:hypothetical protein